MIRTQTAALRGLLALSVLVVGSGTAAQAQTAGSPATCSEVLQRCLKHADIASPHPGQTRWTSAPVAPENRITREQCQREMQQARSSGLWPGHYGSKPIKCK